MRWTLLLLLLTACSGGEGPAAEAGGEAPAPEAGHDDHALDLARFAELAKSTEEDFLTLAGAGMHQSPVDLGSAKRGQGWNLIFHYKLSSVEIFNTGHSFQVNVDPGSWISYHGKRYDLVQFHFHSPSEHTFDGMHGELEVHCVHRGKDGQYAVVGFVMDAGEPAPNFDLMFDYMPEVGKKRKVPDTKLKLDWILPEDREHFWHYSGSLTTPPYTENVEWVILKTHQTASAEQIAHYREFYSGTNRPVQPLNDRVIDSE